MVPAETTRPSPRQNYFPALDGLRAVAFLMVFGIHYLDLPWGFAGVDAFFVLSGFLITGILVDTRSLPHRATIFYLRRSFRIFPLYYGLLIALLLTYPFFRWQWSLAWLVWPAYIGNYVRWFYPAAPGSALRLLGDGQILSAVHPTATLYLGHFWSLCVEEQFYLFWPWVVFWVKDRRKLIYICVAAVVLCPLLRAGIDMRLSDALRESQVLYRSTPLRVDALLIGGLIALLRRGRYRAKLLRACRVAFPILVAFIVVWHVLNRNVWHSFRHYVHPTYVFTWGLSFVDVFFACLIVLALEPNSITYRIFNIYPLRWLGRVSYGAYVFHDIFHLRFAVFALNHFGHWRIATAVMAFLFTLVASWASYRWFESPFIRMKDRFAPEKVKTFHAPVEV